MKPAHFLFLSFFALAGCCVAERCDCPNQAAADDIALRFSRDTLSVPAVGFTARETFRLVLVRLPVDTSSGAKADSVLLDPHPVPAGGAPDVTLRRGLLFPVGALGLGGYRYILRQFTKPNARPRFRFELRDVVIASRYTTVNSCCTCYENARKEARVVNGTRVGPLLNLHVPPGSSQPAVVDLRKR